MLKKWTLGIILLSTSLFSQAGFINSEVISTDMVGIEITALFGDGSTDTQIWSALPSISPTTAGIVASDWSLTLAGNTFGDFDTSTGILYGEWTLSNLGVSNGIVGLTVNASIADFYFDIIEGFNPLAPVPGSGDHTPGSEAGRPFVASDASAAAVFSDVYSTPDLFGIMDITGFGLDVGQQLIFLTDTDKAEVPEPSTLFTFALGLIALTSLRKKSSGK